MLASEYTLMPKLGHNDFHLPMIRLFFLRLEHKFAFSLMNSGIKNISYLWAHRIFLLIPHKSQNRMGAVWKFEAFSPFLSFNAAPINSQRNAVSTLFYETCFIFLGFEFRIQYFLVLVTKRVLMFSRRWMKLFFQI